MTEKNILTELTKFLESTAPNVRTCITGLAKVTPRADMSPIWYVDQTAPSRLMLHCDLEHGDRLFGTSDENTLSGGFQFLQYVCRNCGDYEKTYAVVTELKRNGPDGSRIAEIMKLGESPPFGAPISARIEKLLNKDDLELYRKGTRSEAHGLGIGAATYFRRIVDSHWKLLLKELRRAAEKLPHTDLAIFDRALQQNQFSNAVKELKDAIPGKLLIRNGKNPLTLLYKPLSVQLHSLTDDQCRQQAAAIRIVLTALLENIAEVLKDQEELDSAVSRLEQIK